MCSINTFGESRMNKIFRSELAEIMNGGNEMWSLYKTNNSEYVITAFTGGLGSYEYAFLISNIEELVSEVSEYYVGRLANDFTKLDKYCVKVIVE